jgi:hypothetical protein
MAAPRRALQRGHRPQLAQPEDPHARVVVLRRQIVLPQRGDGDLVPAGEELGGATLLAVVAAIVLAFSLTDAPRSAEGVAGYAALSGTRAGQTVTLTVENAEPRATTYRLVQSRGGAQLSAESFTLPPGTRWTSRRAAPGTVTVVLYRGSDTMPIRTLTLPE